ncbi:MAG TPA: thiamine diphosphokinase [Firmicutes bacterium]|nr:thiamine diphosphokinase [Bacillota bacterium]
MGTQVRRCVILASMPVKDYEALEFSSRPGDYIICADNGLEHARRLGLTPDLIVGDFDSCDLGRFSISEQKLIRYPSEKDDTDTMIAIKEGIRNGFKEFLFLGCLGGRIDHTIANIQALFYLKKRGCNGMLVDENHRIFLLSCQSMEIPRKPGFHLSVLSMGERCEGVTLEQVKYPLKNAVLTNSFPLGISNEFAADTAKVTIQKGTALIVLSRDA